MKKKQITSLFLLVFGLLLLFSFVNQQDVEEGQKEQEQKEQGDNTLEIATEPLPFVSKPATLITYPEYPEQIFRTLDYTVHVSQAGYMEEIIVYDRSTHVEPWWGRTEQPDHSRSFCEFAFSGEPVEVRIQVNFPLWSYRVLSASGELTGHYDGQEITVFLEKPETFLLELNGDYNTLLSVFAEEPEKQIPDKGDSQTWVIEGYYEPEGGYLSIDEPGTCIYLAPGSVLCARLSINADDVTIYGRGVVLDPWSNLFAYDTEEAPDSKLLQVKGDHVSIEGIKLLDARNYNLWVDFGVKNLHVAGVKVLSSAATTDGLTLLGTTDSVIQDCFFYCGDNAIVFEEGLTGTRVLDCIVGTSCAAMFPQQDIKGEIIIDGLYVFRADEGLINNRYNNKDWDRTVESVTIRNVNASDCRNLPWFFHGRFMGTNYKNFVFEQIALPQMKSAMDAKLEQPGSLIRIDNYQGDRQTGGYRMNFTDVYVEGVAVENLSGLLIKDGLALNNTYTVDVSQPVCPVRPAAEVMVEQQNQVGEKHRQKDSGIVNLLAERNAPYASIWCGAGHYFTTLMLSQVDGDVEYRMLKSANEDEDGRMITPLVLTEESLRQSEGLFLHFEASAKTAGEVIVRLSAASGGERSRMEKRIYCGDGWKAYDVMWSQKELIELADMSTGSVVLEIIPQGSGDKEILFRGFDMRYQS